MPYQLAHRIHELKKYAGFDLTIVCFLMILIGLEIEACLYRRWYLSFLFLSMICVCLLTLFVLSCLKKKQNFRQVYRIPVDFDNMDSIVCAFSAAKVCDGAYVSFRKYGKTTLRILIQWVPDCEQEQISAQRKKANRLINQAYPVKAEAPLFDALRMARVNLIVCDDLSDELIRRVERDTEKMLGRNESIINAAIALKDKTIVFPDCLHGPSYIEIQKYEAAAKTLCNSLAPPWEA